MLTTAEITDRLKNALPLDDDRNLRSSFFDEPARNAAVLIPLTRPPNMQAPWHVIYTRRTNKVATHKGQVSFPGGAIEPGDEFPIGTALREAREEVGISPDDVSILGIMESLITISNYLVTPVIGEIPWDYSFRPHPDEVERVFTIPLNWLAQEENIEIKHRSVHFPTIAEPQNLKVVYFSEFDQEIVWGISAEITLRLLIKLGLLPRNY